RCGDYHQLAHFPTRRSSDLSAPSAGEILHPVRQLSHLCARTLRQIFPRGCTTVPRLCTGWANPPQNRPGQVLQNQNHSTAAPGGDRKSTRLNSSHVKTTYAV